MTWNDEVVGCEGECKYHEYGEMFGILNQMKESFERNLAETQKDEAANVKAYEDLKAAKVDEIKAGQEQSEAKVQELVESDEKLANAKEDTDDTKESLGVDFSWS